MMEEKRCTSEVVSEDMFPSREKVQEALSCLEKRIVELGCLSFDFTVAVGAVLSPDAKARPARPQNGCEGYSPVECHIEDITNKVNEQIADMKEYIKRVRC